MKCVHCKWSKVTNVYTITERKFLLMQVGVFAFSLRTSGVQKKKKTQRGINQVDFLGVYCICSIKSNNNDHCHTGMETDLHACDPR
jgi:hypothetical protein